MSKLEQHQWIFPLRETCIDADISKLHVNNRLLYGNWLHNLNKGKTFFGLNYNWPDSMASDPTIGTHYDTYVFSWHLEQWDNDWLEKFCLEHPSQQIVVIGEFPLSSSYQKFPNLKGLVFHCWDLYVPFILNSFGENYSFPATRQYRVSSLCNKPSFTKIFVTAHLLKNYYPRDDLLLSWNINKLQQFCSSINFLGTTGRPRLDDLVEYYQHNMKELTISTDIFDDSPYSHTNFTHAAYTNSLINLTNETFVQNQKFSTVNPGPYFSEKTWKCLLAGTSLVPVGQPGTYKQLNEFGFDTNYPWPKDFDSVIGDVDRIESLFKTIDWVLGDQCLDHVDKLQEINLNNYEHIRSALFLELIKQKNYDSLVDFLKSY